MARIVGVTVMKIVICPGNVTGLQEDVTEDVNQGGLEITVISVNIHLLTTVFV